MYVRGRTVMEIDFFLTVLTGGGSPGRCNWSAFFMPFR